MQIWDRVSVWSLTVDPWVSVRQLSTFPSATILTMCGRFALHQNPDVIALQFGVGMIPQFKSRFNIAPSTNILIVREDRDTGRTADLYRWGLIPGWAKDPSIGNKLANVSGETVAEKPSFRAAFKRWRCPIRA
jgi:putative SOS response-associated peptidase YedK